MEYRQNIVIDVFERPSYQYVYAKQADNIARVLNITLTAHGRPISFEDGVTAYFRALKPDGKSVMNFATVNSDGSVTVALSDQTLAVPGEVKADISLINGDAIISTASFAIQVERVPVGKETVSTNEFLVLMETIRESREASAAANKAAQKASDASDELNAVKDAVNKAVNDANTAAENACNAANSAEQETKKAANATEGANNATAEARQAKDEALKAAEMAKKAASGVGIQKKVVDVLPNPSDMDENVIYFVPANQPKDNNAYEKFMLINGKHELMAGAGSDLADYVTKEELQKGLNDKLNNSQGEIKDYLRIKSDLYPSMVFVPAYAYSKAEYIKFEGSYGGSLGIIIKNMPATSNSKRTFFFKSQVQEPSIDRMLTFQDINEAGYVSSDGYFYHSEMTQPIPIKQGGTDATTKEEALEKLGALSTEGGVINGDLTVNGVIYGKVATNYVEGEVATGDTWIDNKPIYRYTVIGTLNASRDYITKNITLDDIGFLIDFSGSSHAVKRNQMFPVSVSGANADLNYHITPLLDTTGIQVIYGAGFTGDMIFSIRLEYTKKEDYV